MHPIEAVALVVITIARLVRARSGGELVSALLPLLVLLVVDWLTAERSDSSERSRGITRHASNAPR